MAPPPNASASALDRLVGEPRHFDFDAAIRLLLLAARNPDPADVVRFRSVASLAQPPAEVLSISASNSHLPPSLATTVFGLVGTSGVLPRGYTELVSSVSRGGSRALHEFMDMLSHRLAAHYARAGMKYRLSRSAELAALLPQAPPDPFATALLALTGYGLGNMVERLAAGGEPLCHYAGFFATRPRSADRLGALVSDWCGRPVEVVQFAGTWLVLPPDEQTRLRFGIFAGQFARLGADATIGSRVWNAQARIVLRIGPLDLPAFDALLPGGSALRRLVSLVRSFLGLETGFAINPVLAAASIPPLQLGGARLGWNTWFPSHGRRQKDGAEAQFEAETVEALEC
ncbi:MAG: type VI secretion system baseplate subunit TssG [Acetobacteraceae bacterium]|nr:type VI secretion system baseplate subunit TssG [Acetobacteraceae bacterium]